MFWNNKIEKYPLGTETEIMFLRTQLRMETEVKNKYSELLEEKDKEIAILKQVIKECCNKED